jgi:hypothetical protein
MQFDNVDGISDSNPCEKGIDPDEILISEEEAASVRHN